MNTHVRPLAAVLLIGLAFTFSARSQIAVNSTVLDSLVTVLLNNESEAKPVGTGIIVRADGYILTPLNLVKGAKGIQIRLRNGEIYDNASIAGTDERRNIALLHVNAAGLRTMPATALEEAQVGSKVSVLMNPNGDTVLKADVTLRSVQMAQNIAGAGDGYRLLEVDPTTGANLSGALVIDEAGHALGVVTTTAAITDRNIAVPMTSILGLIRSAQSEPAAISAAVPSTVARETPFPIPQASVLMPERGVTSLAAKGPGSVVVKPKTIPEVLAVSRTIFVESGTTFFKPDQLINALNSKPEFRQLGYTFVTDRSVADLILSIDHVLFTYKFTFKLYSERLGTVVATGSRIIWDGNLGAPYMADRVMEKLKDAQGPVPAPNAKPDGVTPKPITSETKK